MDRRIPSTAQDVREEELQIQVLGKIGGVAQRVGRPGNGRYKAFQDDRYVWKVRWTSF